MDRESRARVELLVANVTLEVLRFLVLDQDLFVVKLPVAIPVGNLLFSSRENLVLCKCNILNQCNRSPLSLSCQMVTFGSLLSKNNLPAPRFRLLLLFAPHSMAF